jgi:hypothetical protein
MRIINKIGAQTGTMCIIAICQNLTFGRYLGGLM